MVDDAGCNSSVTGIKAEVTLPQCLHDRIALHELARLRHEFSQALRRTCGPVKAPLHIQVGAQTDADDQRTFVGDQTESSCQNVYLPTRSSLANESDHLICQLRKLFFLKPLGGPPRRFA